MENYPLFKLAKRDVISLGVVAFLILSVAVGLVLTQKTQIFKSKADVDPTDISYEMNVLVIKYFPLTSNGQNIDIATTGDVGESYQEIRQRTINVTNDLKSSLERATTYLGYKDSNAQPALLYNIIDTKEYTQAVPIRPTSEKPTYPDYYGIMESNNICEYVNNRNVAEVWLWAYQGPGKADGSPYLNIYESKMSGLYDISNSGRENDMPKCNKSYRVYTFNYGRGTFEALESWGHQMEAELSAVDGYLFRNIFQGPYYPACNPEHPGDLNGDGRTDNRDSEICRTGKGNGIGRCGSVHNPPNSMFEYNRNNPTSNKSDCLDWNPDGIGTLTDISCSNWGCMGNPDLSYQIWMWQNLPGRKNNKYYGGAKLRNWWDVHGDFDNILNNDRRLTLALASPMPSSIPIASPIPSPSPRPVASPTPRATPFLLVDDLDGNGVVDIFDYNIIISHFGSRMPIEGSPADLDHDGNVDIFDYNIFVTNYPRS